MDPELKALLEKQGQAFDAFKAANDTRLAEIEKRGTATAEATAQVEKISAQLSEIVDRVTEVETQAARPALGGETAAPEAKARKAAFLGFMRHGVVEREMRAALVEDATGEILVPEDLDTEIRRQLGKLTIMRAIADVRTTTSNRVRRRSMNEVVVGWGKIELGRALVEGTLVPGEAFQYVEDLYGLTKIGEDELMDADVALEGYVTSSFARVISETEDTGFVVGIGHAADQPEGVLNGAVVTRVNAGQAAAVKADDFIRLAYAVPAQYRRNGAYVVNSQTELAMRLLKDANGQYLWQPALQAGTPASFNGRPIYNQENIPGIPAAMATADVAVFGDFKVGYRIVDRSGMSIKRLAELFSTQGMVGFLAHFRTTGGVVEPDALRILKVPA